MRVCLTSFFVLCLVSCCLAAAWIDPMKYEIVYGRTVQYCEYKGLKLLPFSKIKDYDDCAICRCKGRTMFLECATTLPIIYYPDDSECMAVNIRCKHVWVYRSDPTKWCPPEKRPETQGL